MCLWQDQQRVSSGPPGVASPGRDSTPWCSKWQARHSSRLPRFCDSSLKLTESWCLSPNGVHFTSWHCLQFSVVTPEKELWQALQPLPRFFSETSWENLSDWWNL